MIVCHVVPVIRAVRRAVVMRPRVAAPVAAVAAVRRAPRLLLVCRDVGALAALGTLGGSNPAVAPAPTRPASAPGPVPSGVQGDGAPWGTPLAGPPLPGGTPGPLPPPGLPPGLLFPPGAPPLPVPPGGDVPVVVRVPEVPEPMAVPEPSSIALFGMALLAAAILLHRRARRAPG